MALFVGGQLMSLVAQNNNGNDAVIIIGVMFGITLRIRRWILQGRKEESLRRSFSSFWLEL